MERVLLNVTFRYLKKRIKDKKVKTRKKITKQQKYAKFVVKFYYTLLLCLCLRYYILKLNVTDILIKKQDFEI